MPFWFSTQCPIDYTIFLFWLLGIQTSPGSISALVCSGTSLLFSVLTCTPNKTSALLSMADRDLSRDLCSFLSSRILFPELYPMQLTYLELPQILIIFFQLQDTLNLASVSLPALASGILFLGLMRFLFYLRNCWLWCLLSNVLKLLFHIFYHFLVVSGGRVYIPHSCFFILTEILVLIWKLFKSLPVLTTHIGWILHLTNIYWAATVAWHFSRCSGYSSEANRQKCLPMWSLYAIRCRLKINR